MLFALAAATTSCALTNSITGGYFNNAARSTSCELIALNSMESPEISRAFSMHLEANAPAGTINPPAQVRLRPQRHAHSTAFTFAQTLGTDEDRARRWPGTDGCAER